MRKEEAVELLKAQRIEDWKERRSARIARLPRRLTAVAEALSGESWFGAGRDVSQTSGPSLEALSAKDRTVVFEAILPHFGAHLERMWDLGRRLPYQRGLIRRAFRAPNAALVTLRARRTRLLYAVAALESYEPADAAWVARWSPLTAIDGFPEAIGTLLAAVLDGGGREADDLFDLLLACARGQDEIGGPGRHITRALLTASREEGWEFVEGYLLAAQREEGLRQSILEAVDEAHPGAFRRMLRLILDQGLTRFSATVRAIDTWFGFAWGAPSGRAVDDLVARALRFLDDPTMRDAAIRGGTPEDTYLALWSIALGDATLAIRPAEGLLQDPDPARRYVGTHLLAELRITLAQRALLPALEDADLRVVARALAAILAADAATPSHETFERLDRLMDRLPRSSVTLEPIVWPWTGSSLERYQVGTALTAHLGDLPLGRLLRHLPNLDAHARLVIARRLASETHPGPEVRRALIALSGDPAVSVRTTTLESVRGLAVDDTEAIELEGLFSRKASDLRRALASILLGRGDAATLASVDRLLASNEAGQRLGGLELLRRLVESDRSVEEARSRAIAYRDSRPKRDSTEQSQLEAIAGAVPPTATIETAQTPSPPAAAVPTLSDGLGLLDWSARTPPIAILHPGGRRMTDASLACLRALDDLVHEHRDTPIEIVRFGETTATLPLGEVTHGFPPAPTGGTAQDAAAELPLHDVWEAWWAERPAETRDDDGLELARAMLLPFIHLFGRTEPPELSSRGLRTVLDGRPEPTLRYRHPVGALVEWLVALHLPHGAAGCLLDAAESTFAAIPTDAPVDYQAGFNHAAATPGWRDRGSPWRQPLAATRRLRQIRPDAFSIEESARLWGIERWVGEGGKAQQPGLPRQRPPLEEVIAAFAARAASDADVVAQLIGPRANTNDFRDLTLVATRRPSPRIASAPAIGEIVDRIRRRVVDVELRRGEAPTAASGPALALPYSGGLDVLVRVIRALDREPFIRGYRYDSLGRQVVFSRLARGTFPGPDDGPAAFAEQMRAAGVGERRLVDLGCFTPQWADHVEAAVGWDGLGSAIWWMHAHSKDPSWTVDREVRDAWKAEVSDRTPLTGDELEEGAVDVDWFRRVYAALGPERWKVLDASVKYGSTAGGHKRAQLFADAMRGAVGEPELLGRLAAKRHQDVARAIGLLPLPESDEREAVVLARYRALQEFIRTSRQFGSSRQASEKRAGQIGLENLARTAGYADPIRLGWAMEARGVADLADGPLTVTVGDVQVVLAIDEAGEPDLAVTRGGVMLKAIPESARKAKEVTALRTRATDLRRQASRMRGSLEMAMIRGDAFSGAELRELVRHPLLAPQLARLVLVGEGGAGYPVADGLALRNAGGREQAVGRTDVLRVAHPVDLLGAPGGFGWSAWQADCFRAERVQPFKQVFRELYVPTATELAEPAFSRRYAGHQVQPRKALALLGGRGWVAHVGEGVRKVFHEQRLAALLGFLEPFGTPAEIEGLTLEAVAFVRKGTWTSVPLGEVPPRLFSEVMRDMDLVVSVAHAGGVDPEASASSIEMRSSLVAETSRLLDLSNVRLDGPRAIVAGQLAEYSVHLGSGVIHLRPGGALFIVPVHGQHRGRLFLPFVDDDPKTAEVLSKVLLLARDREIRDPAILEQIRRA